MVGVTPDENGNGKNVIVLKVFDEYDVHVVDENMNVLFAENLIAQLEVAIETVKKIEKNAD
jgi:hypothetical protein